MTSEEDLVITTFLVHRLTSP